VAATVTNSLSSLSFGGLSPHRLKERVSGP
jgi:hypothetical protein